MSEDGCHIFKESLFLTDRTIGSFTGTITRHFDCWRGESEGTKPESNEEGLRKMHQFCAMVISLGSSRVLKGLSITH